jgi:predicted DNA-binding ArsR family transcriptional regulator
MSESVERIKLEALRKLLNKLSEDYGIAIEEMTRQQDAVKKKHIERQAEEIYSEMESVEGSIGQLERSTQNPKKLILDWEKDLPKIDFKSAIAAFCEVQEQFGSEAGAALFLLQKSNVMGGEWCLRQIRDLLKSKARDIFPPVRIQFFSYQTLDEVAFLSRLEDCFGIVAAPVDLQERVQHLIEKISSLLCMGRIVLVEILVSASISSDDGFLPWLLQDFWCPLVRKVVERGPETPRMRFIVVILADSVIPTELLGRLCCSRGAFCPEKILELPLENWEELDIYDWLLAFSGLGPLFSKQQIITMARNIYRVSNAGQPSSVYTQLMREFQNLAS